MCSVVQDDFEPPDQIESKKPDIKLNAQCKKCPEKADVVLQKRHQYCRACFLNLVSHKFRSTLGKTKMIKHDEKILVVWHGDASSVALVHLITQGMLENTHKKIKFNPTILFIDESSLWPPELCETNVFRNIIELLKCSFNCYVVKLSSIYSNVNVVNLGEIDATFFQEKDQNDMKLKNHLKEIKSATSKIDFILRLRYLIQTEVARKLQMQKIFTPECGSSLAMRLLSDVILGRGSQISSDIGVYDTKLPDIVTMKPLRELTMKEVTFYNVFNGLEFQAVPSLSSLFNSSDSIQDVTETFICGLQEEYPSTVYTVFHTGDKLKNSNDRDKDTCMVCYNKIDSIKTPITLLRKSTSSITNNCDTSCDSCSCQKKDYSDSMEILKNNLCYGCTRLINDMSTLDVLPSSVVEKAKLRLQQDELRSQIEDFLL